MFSNASRDVILLRLSRDLLIENNGNLSDGEVNDFLNRAIDAQGLDFVQSHQTGWLFKTFKNKKLKQEVRYSVVSALVSSANDFCRPQGNLYSYP